MIIEYEGKQYRCDRVSDSESDCGKWSFYYKNDWHAVINYILRSKLNKLLKVAKSESVQLKLLLK